MLDILVAMLGVLITIFLIIGIHEFGHFIVARLCHIEVVRFSIGFGKTLLRWHDKKGTEYALSIIPLGGYVKMLDQTAGNIPPNKIHVSYESQPIYKKLAVILAGPLFNLLFAFLIYTSLFMIGVTSLVPVIGNVSPQSIAAKAGLKPLDEIRSINQHPTMSWMNVIIQLLNLTGETGNITMGIKPLHARVITERTLDLTNWHMESLKPDPLASLGIQPYEPIIQPIIGTIQTNSPAATAKLQSNDLIIAIENKPVQSWLAVINIVKKHPDQTLLFTLKRQGKIIHQPVNISKRKAYFAPAAGFLGATPHFVWPKSLIRTYQFGLPDALSHAWSETYDFTMLNFLLIGKMITGKISTQSLGGPITIFETAGQALNNGFIPFLSVLAFLSIAIGVINLLPIPGLDGGHVLFLAIETIKRSPLSANLQNFLYRLGIIFLFLLLAQSIANDLLRLA